MKNTKQNWTKKADIFLNKHISLLSCIMIVLIFWLSYTLLRDNNIFGDIKMLAITNVMFILGMLVGIFFETILVDLERKGILFTKK